MTRKEWNVARALAHERATHEAYGRAYYALDALPAPYPRKDHEQHVLNKQWKRFMRAIDRRRRAQDALRGRDR